MLMDDHLARMAQEFGDRTAFAVVDVGSMTFAEWDGAANALARRLLESGLEPGGRVGIHLHPEFALRWLVSYSAAHRAGGVAVPMNPRLASAEVAHVLAHSGTTVVVADGDLVGQRSRGSGGPPRRPDRRRHARRDGSRDVPAWPFGPPPRVGRCHRRRPLALPGAAPERGPGRHPLHLGHHRSAQGGGGASLQRVDDRGGRAELDRGGLAACQPAVHLRRHRPRLHPDEARSAGHLPAAVRRRPLARRGGGGAAHGRLPGPGHGAPAPRPPRLREADLSSVQMCSVGSAPLAPFVVERLQEKMPDALVSNNYGMTEAGSAYCIMPQGEAVKRPGSVGQIAPPGCGAASSTSDDQAVAARRGGRGAAADARAASVSTSTTPRPPPTPGRTAGWSPATLASSTRTGTSTSSGAPRT